MSDLSQKLINGDALDSFAKKLNDKIQDDIKEVDTKVSTHNHDDKYYTESEIDTKLANKADKEHGTHLTLGTGSGNAFRGDYGNTAYNHSQAAHAPSNAQKNSDITKAEIEAKLTGAITSHTHNYAGSSSAGGAATSANKVNTDLTIKLNSGTTEGTNLFTFNGSAAKTINITPSSIGAAASSHGTHLTLGTGSSNAYYGDKGKIAYDHSQAAHAPSNAQKNSDITKAEIEAKLTGEIATHTHAGESIYYLPADAFTVTKGSSTSGSYLSTKWNVANASGITEPYDGMIIAIRVPSAGLSTAGVVLSIDGGTTYHPVVFNTSTVLTTYYSVGSTIIVTYNSTQTATAYLTSNTKTTPAGVWQISDYDSDKKTGTTNKVNAKMFIIGASKQSSSGQTTYSNVNCYIGTDNCLYSNGLKVASVDDIPEGTTEITTDIIDQAFTGAGL